MSRYHGSSRQQADINPQESGLLNQRQDPWMRNGEDGDQDASSHWLLSYLDVMTLLFCFFVMLFAWERGLKTEPVVTASLPPASGQPAVPQPAAPAIPAAPVETLVAEKSDVITDDGENPDAPLPFMEPETALLTETSQHQPDGPAYVAALLPEHFPDMIPESAIHSATPAIPAPTETATTLTPPMPETVQAQSPATPIVPIVQVATSSAATLPAHEQPAEMTIPAELDRMVEVHKESHAYRLEVSEKLLFAPAQAKLTPEGQHLIEKLVDPLRKQKGMISVEGHTDNIPISTALYPSNWELSSARATAVTRALIQKGIPAQQIQAIGLADNFPKGDNATHEGRLMNRRVSLVVQVPAEG